MSLRLVRFFRPTALLFAAACLALCLSAPTLGQTRDSLLQFELSDQLKKGANLWNQGDLDGFLGDYLDSDELTFTSGGRILKGYEALAERYRKSYGETPETMGRLSFSDIDVWRLSEDRALVLGRWKLDYPKTDGKTTDDGVFTLVMVKGSQGWRILHDHTSLRSGR